MTAGASAVVAYLYTGGTARLGPKLAAALRQLPAEQSIAAEAGDPCAFVVGRPTWVAGRPSEEHLPLEVTGKTVPEPGDLLQLIPAHVCPTVNLADMAVLLEGEAIVSTTRIAARGHELIP